MRPLFVAILKLACRYQDKKTIFRLRDQWIEVDPREWNAEMDADVRVWALAPARGLRSSRRSWSSSRRRRRCWRSQARWRQLRCW